MKSNEQKAGSSLPSLPALQDAPPSDEPPPLGKTFFTSGADCLQELGISYEDLFSAAPTGLALLADQGTILICNTAMGRTCGYSHEELLNLDIGELFLENARRLDFKEALGRKAHIRNFAAALVRKDGSSFTSNLSMIPVSAGHRQAFLVVLQDITKETRAREDLRDIRGALLESREQLHQAQKMNALGILVAGIAHEINNSVNQISFNAPLLHRIWQDLEPEIRAVSLQNPSKTYGGLTSNFLLENIPQLLGNMEMAANRIAEFVSELKQFSRYSTVNDMQPVQLNNAVNNAVSLAQTTLKKAGIALILDLDERLPLMEGNPKNLEQITLNILINALQAMEGDPGEIRMRTRPSSEKRIVLSVSDSGKGIPEEIGTRVFDPFVTTRQEQGGTGLGLSVTQSLVKAHKGEIYFETGKGVGTTFFVVFPST